MRVRASMIAGLCILAVAACSPPAAKTGDAQTSDANQARANMAAGLTPGQYRTTMTILEMNTPGLPAGVAEKMRSQPMSTESCVTSSDINDMMRSNMRQEDNGMSCTQNDMHSGNGRIEGSSTCTGPMGQQTMHMSGTYSSNHVEMDIDMTGQMPGGRGEMSQKMHMVTDRIGDCPAGSENAN